MLTRTSTSALIETVVPGKTPTRANSLIFILLLALASVTCLVFGGVDTGTWTVISLVAAVIVVAWAADAWITGGVLFYRSWLPVTLAGLVAVGAIQLIGGISLDAYATRLQLIRLIVYLIVFLAALAFINTATRVQATTYFIIVFGSLLGFFGILQRLADPGAIFGLRETPQAIPFGPFVNQHHFASFMAMTGGLAFGLLFARTATRERRLLLAVAAAVMGVALAFTSSRGGLIAFMAALVVAFALSYGSKSEKGAPKYRMAAIGVGIVFAAMVIIFGGLLVLGGDQSFLRYAGFGVQSGDISNGRMHFWSIALRIFAAHPIIGAGLDAFGVAFTRYDTWDGTFRIEQAHNDYLQMLADAGIIGFACVAGFVTIFVRQALATIRSSVSDRRRSIAIGAFAGCVGILVHSFFDFPLRTPSNTFFFILLIALATVRVEATSEP